MVRFSVPLDEAQNEWVEERAEELNGSKAQVMSMLVDAAMQGDLHLADAIGESQSNTPTDLDKKLDLLETRLKELEATVSASQDPTDSPDPASTPDTVSPTEPMTNPEDNDEPRENEVPPASPSAASSSSIEAGAEDSNPSSTDEPTGASESPLVSAQETEASTSEPSAEHQDTGGFESASDDPETNAVRSYIERNETGVASPDEITACWKLLQKRGTANPDAFKERCHAGTESDSETLDDWWEDGVKPVLKELPGVDPPQEGGRLYRYSY
jgi:hypothetical protein